MSSTHIDILNTLLCWVVADSRTSSLIWYQIPASAIIKTFSLEDITRFAHSSSALRRVLRLDQLASVKSSATEIIKTLKQDDVKISRRVANVIAEIVLFHGLDHTSSREALARAGM